MADVKREPGYYWVKFKGEWYVFYWSEFFRCFLMCGNRVHLEESDIEEIDERRITRD